MELDVWLEGGRGMLSVSCLFVVAMFDVVARSNGM